MSDSYDVIIIGIGGMGAAVARSLAAAGMRVLGLEQFGPVHDRGSSYGRTRVIRKAYFEDPRYVPMLHRTYELWREVEAAAGETLLDLCGCLNIGPADHVCVQGAKRSAVEHGLAYEELDAAEIARRFPAFAPAANDIGIYESEGGLIYVDRAQHALIRVAEAAGATLQWHEPVRDWAVVGDGVEVVTANQTYRAGQLVICAGGWLGKLVPQLSASLKVERQPQLWFAPADMTNFRPGRLPSFVHFVGERAYFGIPSKSDAFVKIGRHHGGAITTADEINRTVNDADEADVRDYIRAHMPSADGPLVDKHVCMYTNTPDDHFVIDRHPQHACVHVVGGFSGHGYKFAPWVGETICAAVQGETRAAGLGLFEVERLW